MRQIILLMSLSLRLPGVAGDGSAELLRGINGRLVPPERGEIKVKTLALDCLADRAIGLIKFRASSSRDGNHNCARELEAQISGRNWTKREGIWLALLGVYESFAAFQISS
jgi:hypothetical protein